LSCEANYIICGKSESPKGKWLPVLKALTDRRLIIRDLNRDVHGFSLYHLTETGKKECTSLTEMFRSVMRRIDGCNF
jgi:hypothetical protein